MSAQAASFDCAKAASAMEKLICADPALSKADEVLAEAYASALKPLSEDGRKAMRDSQRQWLHFVAQVCRIVPTAGLSQEWDRGPPTECLGTEFQRREKQLRKASLAMAGIVLRRSESFAARRAPPEDDNGNRAGFVTTELAYPLIDAPKSDGQRVFNEKMTTIGKKAAAYAAAPSENPDTDESFDYRIDSVSSRAITISFEPYEYAHGAPHGYDYPWTLTWLIDERRELRSHDLFLAADWRKALDKLATEALAQQAAVTGTAYSGATTQSIDNIAGDIKHWTLGRAGLTIHFPVYSIGSHAEGAPEVTIPWTKLQPYLASGALDLVPVK